MSFILAYNKTLGYEGLVSYDERGGQTYKGIARKMHPNWEGWAIVDKVKDCSTLLSAPTAAFYRKEFWCKCEDVDRLSEKIAEELFDSCVNCGISNGVKFLQRALNRLNVDGKFYKDLVVDGEMGPATLKAVEKCILSGGEELLFKCQNGEQYMYYTSLSEHEKYRGWFKRT